MWPGSTWLAGEYNFGMCLSCMAAAHAFSRITGGALWGTQWWNLTVKLLHFCLNRALSSVPLPGLYLLSSLSCQSLLISFSHPLLSYQPQLPISPAELLSFYPVWHLFAHHSQLPISPAKLLLLSPVWHLFAHQSQLPISPDKLLSFSPLSCQSLSSLSVANLSY